MTNEIVLTASIKAVSSALGAVLKTYRATHATNKAELERLNDAIAASRRIDRANNISRIFRQNIEEIARTQKMIDTSALTGEALGMAFEHLRLLHEMLIQNAREYSRG